MHGTRDPLARRYRRSEELVTRAIAGETIIVPVCGRVCDLDSIYTLNASGAAVWRQLDGRATVREVVEGVLVEFEAGPEEVERDTLELLASLERAGLALPCGEEGAA